ncbi:hypothetical protein Q5P01_024306 [Channa striata]|uniref:Uncharacterized protein n=1 Tax=Channa striata TaxID=64152 RepID=A0AA88J7M7_CHASR|nr:hypothetical protein Q5P01_024306 [Channa striata]
MQLNRQQCETLAYVIAVGAEGDSTGRASGGVRAPLTDTDTSPRHDGSDRRSHEHTRTVAAVFCATSRLNHVIVFGGRCTPLIKALIPLH